MLLRALAVLAIVSLSKPNDSDAQHIYFRTTLEGESCYVPDQNPAVLYIVAKKWSSDGISGAEFSVDGFPHWAYKVESVPSPQAAFAVGDPFHGGGLIEFSGCQTEEIVLLYTVTITRKVEPPVEFISTLQGHSTGVYGGLSPIVLSCQGPPEVIAVSNYGTALGPVLAVPRDPSPPNQAEQVSVQTRLSARYYDRNFCCAGSGAPIWWAIYLGEEPDPPFLALYTGTFPPQPHDSYDPGNLKPETTYYWRIEYAHGPNQNCGHAMGPIWSFTTSSEVPVEGVRWARIKRLYK